MSYFIYWFNSLLFYLIYFCFINKEEDTATALIRLAVYSLFFYFIDFILLVV